MTIPNSIFTSLLVKRPVVFLIGCCKCRRRKPRHLQHLRRLFQRELLVRLLFRGEVGDLPAFGLADARRNAYNFSNAPALPKVDAATKGAWLSPPYKTLSLPRRFFIKRSELSVKS